ncbi:hypothetical protein INR49_031219 [Caranx melampygus]|nr:hypothetical protein INR49_031219 [Caranx melampygus]
MEKAWRCPADRRSLQDKSDSLLRDSNVQNCIDLTELQTQPNSTILVGTADTHFQLPAHSDYSIRRISAKTYLQDRSVLLYISYRLPYLSDPVVPLLYQQGKVGRGWLDSIYALTGSSGGPQLPSTVRMYHYNCGNKSVQAWRTNQEDREEAVTSHYLDTTVSVTTKDSRGGEFTGIKVLATVSVAVAMVLAALAVYLCLNWNRQSCNSKGEPVLSRPSSPPASHAVLSSVKGSLSTQSERVTLRIPTPDNESDTEVPYADIMIAARGVSTPELTQVCYLTPGDQKEWRGDESRSYLQASRSADRLHVLLPREVSRKMSTNSECILKMSVPFSNTHLRVPRGFGTILEGLAREILRDQPEDIPKYATQYLEALLKQREESGMDPAEWAARLEDRFYNNHAFKTTDVSPGREPALEVAISRTVTH